MKFFCTTFVFCILLGVSLATQAPESRGTDFFVAFAYNYQTGLGQTQTLYISSDFANTIVVQTKTQTITTVNVAAHGTVGVDVSSIYVTGENSIQNVGIRVTSTSATPFTLVGLNTYTATSDGFLAFPVNVLGTSYMAAGYTGCCGTAGYMYVLATQDGTTVNIAGSRTLDGHSNGQASYTLNSYQVVLVGINNGDITGFTVNSNKPVALFAGAACSDVPVGIYACNVLVDQIPPINTWDSDFITVPIATRTAGDIFRVVSNVAGTVVTVNGANVATLASGAWYEFSSAVPNVIHTSHPALVMQYDKGSSADGVSSDPFQIWIPPVSQFSANYYISAPTGTYWSNWASIVVRSGQQSGLSIDGHAITTTFKPISGSNYVYTQTPITGGTHQVTHSSPIEAFEVIVYGFGSYDGFGYVGGNRLAPLQDPCTPTPTVPADGIDNDCDGRIDEEIRNGIDDDGDGLIDEDLAADTCCYGNQQVPTLSASSSTADTTISCGAPLPTAATVTATVACSTPSSYTVTPVVTTTAGACPSGSTIKRTWSVTDACGRTATIVQTISVTSVCGNGVVEAPEQCDGGACCSSSCTYQSSSTVCRASSGLCDAAEFCSGSSSSCPADSFQSSSTVCRASSGPCDVAESCSGSSASCPADSFQSSSTVCRASNGVCDVAETCTGSSGSCPADSFQSSSTVCRASGGVCDVAEQCTGSSASCPADSFQSSSTVCRASGGVCDVAEQCTGSSASCPADSFQSSSTVCRASNGVCDVPESCTGSSSSCPADSFQSSSVTCRASNGVCDVAEQCTGSSASCPADSFQSSSTVCRASNGVCDVPESCSGSSASCPADSFQSSSVTCRASNGVCDVAEQCTGSSASCPSDSFQSSSTVCRASAGVCDVAESCTGSSASCPSDSFQPSSTVCRASVGPCDPQEQCSGSSASCSSDINGEFETACPGLNSFTSYDVIAFGDFTANTGDIEQRLAVGGNFRVGNGWSVGYEINSADGHQQYSLLVNGNAVFGSGSVYPDGSGYPVNVPEEDIFVSGTFTGPDYLASRVTSLGSVGTLSSNFAAAQSCYAGFQSSLAANTDNVEHMLQWSGLYLTCQDPLATTYYLTLTATEINSYSWTSINSCNGAAKWIINVVGNDDVTFNGGSFPANANQVLWNVQGSGRTINVGWTQVDGSILAPYNNINQPTGVIIGKVIANNIVSLQINKYQCYFQ